MGAHLPHLSGESPSSRSPSLSLVIPCLNEARYLPACLDAVLANDYPQEDLEILVVDGGSSDGTRAIVEEYARRHPSVRLLENIKRVTPAGLNVGIRLARGTVILRMDAHAVVSLDYVRRCVAALREHPVENVGGVILTLPRDPSPFAEAIAAALSHPFGVGGSSFRSGGGAPRLVDSVFGGCYRREIFERIGYFNEALTSSQDIEFNARLRRAGGRILLLPDVVSRYYTRSGMWSFTRNNFRNGMWAMLPFAYVSGVPIAWRHAAPMAFVMALAGAAAGALAWPPAASILLALAGAYALAVAGASAHVAWRRKRWRLLPAMPVVFAALHVVYGCGSLVGAARAVAARVGRYLRS